MGRLKILARGNSPQAQAQARGKLFEDLMALVLRHFGYQIDKIPSVNYAGMEIDIEGKAIITDIPLYAECKCFETEVDSPKLQAFFGKYMTRWLKDRRCQGLFVALPGVNSHAKGFYRENCEGNSEITFRLIEEDQVLNAIFESQKIARPEIFAKAIRQNMGTPGDWLVLYTSEGLFWVQYIIRPGKSFATSLALFDATGSPLASRETLDSLTQLYPELDDFEHLSLDSEGATQGPSPEEDVEQIVEVRGSSACFEYQFPASPEYFVGRESILEELDSFASEVIEKTISSRGIVFEANSGWGKSSVVLASVARLRENGHFAVAIDSRTASSSQFILRAVDYTFSSLDGADRLFPVEGEKRAITGFDGAVDALVSVGKILENKAKVLFIFLDQFENVFFLFDAISRVRDLFVKVSDAQTNIVFGFSWKTDLVGSTHEFPYLIRDTITGTSRRIGLDTFSELETTTLLDKLSQELHAPLRKDLRFFLSEFSQGYPWLLKKLCAHVKAQREAGVRQQDIADSLLNVEELFQDDLRGLSAEEDETLRRIARVAPVSVLELGEEFKPQVVQSLVNARLVVRVGSKYDVYWDIFRDYVNAGRVPVQENYILHIPASSMFRTTKLLAGENGALSTSEFQTRAGVSKKSFYNVIRDMRLLGLAKVVDDNVILLLNRPAGEKEFEELFRTHSRERLRRNRLVWRILETLEIDSSLTIDEISKLLADSCPYISASEQTWRIYARVFAEWMDAADLATYNKKEATVHHYSPGTEVRERNLIQGRSRGAIATPIVQYEPIEDVGERLINAINGSKVIDWTGVKRTTRSKALAALEQLGFIVRKRGRITVGRELREFVGNPAQRPSMFASRALKMTSFAAFVKILQKHQTTGRSLGQLGVELRSELKTDWKDSTAETNAKVMLNWARHAGLAPEVFVARLRPDRNVKIPQMPLFQSTDT